jgi:hypothetical protein
MLQIKKDDSENKSEWVYEEDLCSPCKTDAFERCLRGWISDLRKRREMDAAIYKNGKQLNLKIAGPRLDLNKTGKHPNLKLANSQIS